MLVMAGGCTRRYPLTIAVCRNSPFYSSSALIEKKIAGRAVDTATRLLAKRLFAFITLDEQ